MRNKPLKPKVKSVIMLVKVKMKTLTDRVKQDADAAIIF